jgi:hypothetical protein
MAPDRTAARPLALANAVIFFAGWMAILWAGADHPPPPRFLALVPLVLLAAGLVYWRLPVYLRWMETGGAGRLLNVASEGILAGALFAALGILLSRILGGGEPGVEPSAADIILWFIVLAAVGAGNALLIYLINLLLRSREW